MAQIVIGIGASHSPLLNLGGADWNLTSVADQSGRMLNLSDGRMLTYAELHAEVGDRYAEQATCAVFADIEAKSKVALDRLVDELASVSPDIVVVIGDDQGELYDKFNMPCIAIYYGDEIVTTDRYANDRVPQWQRLAIPGFAMDEVHRFPGAPDSARALIAGLMREEIDVTATCVVSDPHKAGFGHAYGFVIERLYTRSYPTVPILLNTYFPPNVVSASRAYDIGVKLKTVIERDWPTEQRVAVIASGGLSHFVTDPKLDIGVLAAIEAGDAAAIRNIPREGLLEGSSEILNWLVMAGAARGLTPKWREYYPVYRTPAGTGVGLAFMTLMRG